jgi:hypothetical protein
LTSIVKSKSSNLSLPVHESPDTPKKNKPVKKKILKVIKYSYIYIYIYISFVF